MKNVVESEASYLRVRRSDLAWVSDSPVPIRPRSASCQCGAPVRLKQTLEYFSEHSSLHGTRYLCPGTGGLSRIKKFFYRCLFAACVVLLLANVNVLLRESRSSQQVSIVRTSKGGDTGILEDDKFPEHPRITICRRPGYKTDVGNATEQELLEYAYLSLGIPFTPLTPREMSLLIESVVGQGSSPDRDLLEFESRMQRLSAELDKYAKETPDFDLEKFINDSSVSCEDVFSRCMAFVFELDCCRMFTPQLTTLGVCFSHVPDRERIEFMKKGGESASGYVIDLKAAPRQENKALIFGYEVYLSDPRQEELTFPNHGHYLVNGRATAMTTSLVKTSRVSMFTPWHGLSTHCPRLPGDLDPFEYGERYFTLACKMRYLQRIAEDTCGCRPLAHSHSNISLRQCYPKDVGCVVSVALQDSLDGMKKECRPPCLEYHYKSSYTLLSIGDPNISRLMFRYDRAQYSLDEYKLKTLSSFLSQIGGALGLYLGASVVTAMEIITCLASWTWYKFAPQRRRASSKEKTSLPRKTFPSVNYGDVFWTSQKGVPGSRVSSLWDAHHAFPY